METSKVKETPKLPATTGLSGLSCKINALVQNAVALIGSSQETSPADQSLVAYRATRPNVELARVEAEDLARRIRQRIF